MLRLFFLVFSEEEKTKLNWSFIVTCWVVLNLNSSLFRSIWNYVEWLDTYFFTLMALLWIVQLKLNTIKYFVRLIWWITNMISLSDEILYWDWSGCSSDLRILYLNYFLEFELNFIASRPFSFVTLWPTIFSHLIIIFPQNLVPNLIKTLFLFSCIYLFVDLNFGYMETCIL